MNTNALIIIAKYPEKNQVKTRLKGQITDNQRLDLYISLLDETINKLKSIPGVDTFIAFAPADSHDYFAKFNLDLIPLPDGDLGERMYHAFREIFGQGYKKAALVGADIPDLTGSIVIDAFEILSNDDVVFGPAEDGGYYLIGMSTLIKELFEDVPWSSNMTLKRSIEQAEKIRKTVGLTTMLYDIDTIDDLKRSGFIRQV